MQAPLQQGPHRSGISRAAHCHRCAAGCGCAGGLPGGEGGARGGEDGGGVEGGGGEVCSQQSLQSQFGMRASESHVRLP